MTTIIQPQPGPQTNFLKCGADIVFYGGAAGGGKTYALLLEVLRHFHNPKFGAVIFRRTYKQIRNEGGLWDESYSLFKPLGARPREVNLDWEFPSGARLTFAHLEHENDVYSWQGGQVPLFGFDEVTHFTEKQFTYMFSRNRSMSGVPGYIRATCNPDATSWVRKWVDWYVDPQTGFVIPERSGVIRYFVRRENALHWFSTEEEARLAYPDEKPKSFSFIFSKLEDNAILMAKDPNYLYSLRALPKVERERLLFGNWNIKATAGNFFRREWFEIIDTLPVNYARSVRFWDRAATRPTSENQDPDWTRGLKLLKYRDGNFIVADLKSLRDTPLQVEKLIRSTAQTDGVSTAVICEQEGGSSGVADANSFVRLLAGFNARVRKPTTNKAIRAKPVSAQAEAGNIKILKGSWNEEFLNELENFSDNPKEYAHDDIVDALSGAFNELNTAPSILDVL